MAQNITPRRSMLAGTAALIASAPFAAPALAARRFGGLDRRLRGPDHESEMNWRRATEPSTSKVRSTSNCCRL
jgi:hypothetical protein